MMMKKLLQITALLLALGACDGVPLLNSCPGVGPFRTEADSQHWFDICDDLERCFACAEATCPGYKTTNMQQDYSEFVVDGRRDITKKYIHNFDCP